MVNGKSIGENAKPGENYNMDLPYIKRKIYIFDVNF